MMNMQEDVMLSYRIRNKWDDPELLVSWFHETADEVAKLERVARAADALMDKKSCRRGKEVVELETALADLGALEG